MTRDLTEGSPFRQILLFAFPLYLGMLFQQFYNVVDTIIVGRLLGVLPLAGVGSTGSLNFMVIGFCNGVCSGFAIPVAQRFGAKDLSGMRRYVSNGLRLAAVFSVILAAAVCTLCGAILRTMNTPEDIFDYAYTYIFIIFIGIPFTFLYNILAGILRALGDSRSPVIFLALSSVLNIGLDILCVKSFGMGVGGTALATVIAQAVSGTVCAVYMRKKYPVLHMSAEERQVSLSCMGTLAYMGIPMGLQYSVTAIGSLIFQAAMNGLGSAVVAGSTAAMRIHNFIACPIEALGAAMAPYAGQNMGAGKYDRIRKGTASGILLGFAASAGILALVLLFGKKAVGIFLDVPDAEIIGYAYRILLTMGCTYCLLVIVNVVRFSIQGMGFTVVAIISGVLEMIARSIIGLIVVPRFGFPGACLGHPTAWLFADVFLIPTFFVCQKKVKKRSVQQ